MTSPIKAASQFNIPPPLQKKDAFKLKRGFLAFLSTAVENANTDDWKLAIKNWKHLKEKNIKLPPLIDHIFSSFNSDHETLNIFIRRCEQSALKISKACHIEKPEIAKTLSFDEK